MTRLKRSPPIEIVLAPVALDSHLPIDGGRPYVQPDRPITWLHVHQCLELGYCYRGSGVFMIGEKILPFRAGDVSIINHTEPHLGQSVPGTDSNWTWIYLDPLRLAPAGLETTLLDPTPFAGPAFINLKHESDHPALARVVLRMIDELRSRARGFGPVLQSLTVELMTFLHRASPGLTTQSEWATPDYDRLAPAMQYLAQRYTDPIDIALLARRCGLSEPHFRRLFHRAIGRMPREYWHDLRMRMAASLLKTTTRPILTISHDVGFDTLSSFNRVFRSTFGTNPRSWRKG